jgi:hypothetical protein
VLLRKAQAAGMRVVIFTVDSPIKQANFIWPAGVSAVNLDPDISPFSQNEVAKRGVFGGYMTQAPTWDDVQWLRQETQNHSPTCTCSLKEFCTQMMHNIPWNLVVMVWSCPTMVGVF